MIDYINGKIAELSPAKIILDVNGVGYDINISLNSYAALQNKETAKIYIFESIREDAWVLYGFFSREERQLFLLLTSVSGIGGNTARMILSSFSPAELCQAIGRGDENLLIGIKGIGKRSAQRIIVELQDKIPQIEAGNGPITTRNSKAVFSEKEQEAIQALSMLGFSPVPTKKIVAQILSKTPELTIEEIIKRALKSL